MLQRLLTPVLKKGGAGASLSREETVTRINPIIETHTRLLHNYQFAIDHTPDAPVVDALRAVLRTARMDVGKLCETVFSAGGTAFSGTSIEPGSLPLDGQGADLLRQLEVKEKELLAQVEGENEVWHQIRTQAILGVVKKNSEARLTLLGKILRTARS